MSDAFFKAMEDSRNERKAGFVKSLKPFPLPEPVNFTMYFTRETSAEQMLLGAHEVPEGSSGLATQIVSRAKTSKGVPMFEPENWDAAAKKLMELDVTFLIYAGAWIEKNIDKVEADKFEKMLGNLEETATSTTSAI